MRRSYIQSICKNLSRKVPGGVGRLKSMIANAADKAHNGRLRSITRSVAGHETICKTYVNVQNSHLHCPMLAKLPPTTGPIAAATLQVLRYKDGSVRTRVQIDYTIQLHLQTKEASSIQSAFFKCDHVTNDNDGR
jgi:hypothetical protein